MIGLEARPHARPQRRSYARAAALAAAAATALTACSSASMLGVDLPESDDVAAAPYPRLIDNPPPRPVDGPASPQALTARGAQIQSETAARADALRAEAEAMRAQPVLPGSLSARAADVRRRAAAGSANAAAPRSTEVVVVGPAPEEELSPEAAERAAALRRMAEAMRTAPVGALDDAAAEDARARAAALDAEPADPNAIDPETAAAAEAIRRRIAELAAEN